MFWGTEILQIQVEKKKNYVKKKDHSKRLHNNYKNNSTTKFWKTASLKCSFRLSETWSRFSRLVCFKYITKFLPSSLWNRIFNTWQTWKQYFIYTISMHENNILWEVTTLKYIIYLKNDIRASAGNIFCCKGFA